MGDLVHGGQYSCDFKFLFPWSFYKYFVCYCEKTLFLERWPHCILVEDTGRSDGHAKGQ